MPKDDLVRQLKAGDERAVDELVANYGQRLLAAALFLCGDATEAQDLMIETVTRAVRLIDKFREASSLYSWLYGILFNLNRERSRRRTRSRLVFVADLPDVPDDLPVSGGSLDEQVVSDWLAHGIRKLPEIHREVVVLRYYGEQTIPEIAEALGINPGTVKSRLFNAVRDLKTFLPKEMNDLL